MLPLVDSLLILPTLYRGEPIFILQSINLKMIKMVTWKIVTRFQNWIIRSGNQCPQVSYRVDWRTSWSYVIFSCKTPLAPSGICSFYSSYLSYKPTLRIIDAAMLENNERLILKAFRIFDRGLGRTDQEALNRWGSG